MPGLLESPPVEVLAVHGAFNRGGRQDEAAPTDDGVIVSFVSCVGDVPHRPELFKTRHRELQAPRRAAIRVEVARWLSATTCSLFSTRPPRSHRARRSSRTRCPSPRG